MLAGLQGWDTRTRSTPVPPCVLRILAVVINQQRRTLLLLPLTVTLTAH